MNQAVEQVRSVDGELGALYATCEENDVLAASFGMADELIAKAEKRIKEWTRVLLGIDTKVMHRISLLRSEWSSLFLMCVQKRFHVLLRPIAQAQGSRRFMSQRPPHWMCVIVCGFC